MTAMNWEWNKELTVKGHVAIWGNNGNVPHYNYKGGYTALSICQNS